METNKKNYIKTIGYVLIAPALISVPLVFIELFFFIQPKELPYGDFDYKYYIGFIGAIGAYLLKDKN